MKPDRADKPSAVVLNRRENALRRLVGRKGKARKSRRDKRK